MKMRSILIACSLSWGILNAAFAQKQTPPAGGQPKDFVLPAKKADQLKNGLRSTLVQYGSIPKVSINIIVKTGNVHEAANEVWLADLTGNLMQEGTKGTSTLAWARIRPLSLDRCCRSLPLT